MHKNQIRLNLKVISSQEYPSEFDKDIWDGRVLGADIRPGNPYTLNFSSIYQPWLKAAGKRFIRYTFATSSWKNCQNRLLEIKRFSCFLAETHPNCAASQIDRSIIIEYLSYIMTKGWKNKTKAKAVTQLKIFLEFCTQNNWAELPDKTLIYREDIPKEERKRQPRYIPQEVLDQLNQQIGALPESVMRMVLVIQESGMRVSELCRLKFDCLRQDAAGDWWLNYYQFKMSKDHSITISRELAAVIQEQQKYISHNFDSSFPYLFCGRKKGNRCFIPNNKPMDPGQFTEYIKRLGKEHNICDASGRPWNFTSHQFRHSVGTRMINSGVPQHIIQRYLGHESPNMTAVYAHIFDATLKKEIAAFLGKTVNVVGDVIESKNPELDTTDLQWVKRNIQVQALTNGSCALPTIAQSCPHANACLTCSHFRTTIEFLNQHKEQLQQTEKIIEKAKANGWERQVEMNEKVATNLRKTLPIN